LGAESDQRMRGGDERGGMLKQEKLGRAQQKTGENKRGRHGKKLRGRVEKGKVALGIGSCG